MAKKLNTYVHAVARDDKGNVTNSAVFGPDDDLSSPENAWARDAITNPDVWEGDGEVSGPAEQNRRTASTSSGKAARARPADDSKADGQN